MKIVCIVTLLCAFGCSHTEKPKLTDTPTVQETTSETLSNLVYVDVFAPDYTTQHPLIGRSNEEHDMAFKHIQSGRTIHAVFPKGVTPPDDFNGRFELQGHYKATQKRDTKEDRLVKRIPKGYRYFVVSSWRIKK